MILILLFFVLLVLSGFFSGSETAYFHLKTHKEHIPEDVKMLLEEPRKLLVALLTGNTAVNVVMAAIAAIITAKLAALFHLPESLLILIEVAVVTTIILIFGEIFPKLLAIRYSTEFAKKVRVPLKIFIIILHPIAIVFYGISNLTLKILSFKKEKTFDSEEELKILTDVSKEQGTLQSEESEMIKSIFDFHDKAVHEIMVHRVDMITLPTTASLDEIMELIKERQYSKIPIYTNNIDDIIGILYAKDILPYILGPRPKVNIAALVRQPFFVPENKNLDDLLDDFKEKKTNIAIVVDEWGGTSGLITLEDVVEEVIGELRDPYDKEAVLITQLTDSSYLADGKISIYDLEEETDLEFPEERDYDTLGGFIFQQVGDIPKVGEFFKFNECKYTVKSLEGNRIVKVQIQKIER